MLAPFGITYNCELTSLVATIDERIGSPILANFLAFSLAVSTVLPHGASAPHHGPTALDLPQKPNRRIGQAHDRRANPLK